ncbi:DUF455 family protein [Opitutus sp. GAS368]|jgi:hypothetical protein|uniref:DUF455 family protein n=1 Tax=Opitutus sp. GAS368 TaxID=1882749 RepID=UPI00087B3C8D|nr:DUF455 family protein [Opitutus sp. GAS368]SDS18297.1 Protein of unknown function [Opitutus sp. GAS368]
MKTYASYLSPDETSDALRDFFWREFELARMCFGWLPAFDTWEQKWWSGQIGYWHSRHMRFLEQRIRELPGAFPDRSSPPAILRDAYTRISLAPSARAFWTGYDLLLRELYRDYDAFLAVADPVTNSPTLDCLNVVLVERARIQHWLSATPLARYHDRSSLGGPDQEWLRYSEQVLAGIDRAMDGDENGWPPVPEAEPLGPVPVDGRSDPSMVASDYQTRIPQNEKGTYEFYADPANSPIANHTRQMIFINSTEIIASELVAYIFYSSHELPFEFYYDTARHIWDEVRHTEMGLRRLKQLGFKIEDFRYWGPCHVQKDATALDHYEFYSDLTNRAEACSFSYKRTCAEAFRQHGDIVSAVQSEFDVADERLHTGYGSKWSPELFKLATGESMTSAALVERYRIAALKKKGYSAEEIETRKKALNNFCGAAEGLGKHLTTVAKSAY